MQAIRKIIIFSSVCFVIVLLLLVLVVLPLFSSIKRIANDILITKKSLASFESNVLRAEQFKENYDDLEITPETIESLLVNPSAPIEMISFLEELAEKENLLININPAPSSQEGDPWNSVSFNLELGGSFSDTMRFLEKIESGSYFIKTQKVHAKRTSLADFSSDKYQGLSLGDIATMLEIKVFAK